MPARSFTGVGLLVGLMAGAVVGVNFGNLGPSLVIGLFAGLFAGWLIDRVKGLSGRNEGSGDGGPSIPSQTPVIMGMIIMATAGATAGMEAVGTGEAAETAETDQRACMASSTACAARSVSASGS